jgi:hypothetical protein
MRRWREKLVSVTAQWAWGWQWFASWTVHARTWAHSNAQVTDMKIEDEANDRKESYNNCLKTISLKSRTATRSEKRAQRSCISQANNVGPAPTRTACGLTRNHRVWGAIQIRRPAALKSDHLRRTQEHQNLSVLKLAHRDSTIPKYYKFWSMK